MMGGQPVLAQIDVPAGEAVASPVAVDAAPAAPVVPVAPEVVSVPVVPPPAVVVPSPSTPEFSNAASAPAIQTQVEAITSQVEVVIPSETSAAEPVVAEITTSEVDTVEPDVVAPEVFTSDAPLPDVDIVVPDVETQTPSVEIVKPSDVVPEAIPTAEDLAADFGGVFVDPTDFSAGATLSPDAPEVFVSERSTGCEYKVDVKNIGGCGTTDKPDVVAGAPRTIIPGTVNIGPVSISRSGVRFTGKAASAVGVAGREYYNTVARPLVELQAGESFVFPLASPSPITSLFGWRWHPIHNDYRFHAGTDLGAPQGTPILATQSGQVSVADYLGGYGLTVILRHNDNSLESRYAHMSHILVQPGEWVEQGDVIGLVGSTGNSTGPHLHFELHQLTSQGWVAISPNEVLSYALANLNNGIHRGGPLQALNIIPKVQAAPVKGALPKVVKTETLGTDAPHFRPAQPHAQ
ncbi:MAG: peptidoglycan DD-metalloendopeptidase family protein [Leptolyngbya sp. SIO3F4]|nr:peptidoglycan DD-metalloendopeptidase family protein [Leptolyngbya sp. SIO3F4]